MDKSTLSVFFCALFVAMSIILSSNGGIVYHWSPRAAIVQNSAAADSYTSHGPITITSDADFASQGWPGNGIYGMPYVIEGLNITADAICISISDTTVYFEVRNCVISSGVTSGFVGIILNRVGQGTIQDCTIDRHYVGVFMDSSYNCTVTNNTLSDNVSYGVRLTDSSNCTLTDNTDSSNSQYGFYVESSDNCTLTNNTASNHPVSGFRLQYSNNCTLTNNTAVSNGFLGFWLEYSNNSILTNNTASSNSDYGLYLDTSNNCTLIDNTASSNSDCGLYLDTSNNCTLIDNTASSNSNYGFSLHISDNCTLQNNFASSNGFLGFALWDSDNCTLTHNTAVSNSYSGFYLGTGSENNTLYLNRLGNNSVFNAQDDGAFNIWDDGISSGNFWMDYNTTGTYTIPGSAESVDNYPIVWDIAVPSVNSPSDIEYTEGDSGNSITWTTSDDHPQSYIIYRNGTVIVSLPWVESQITVDIDDLSQGLYNYTIVVYDAVGHSVSDTVFVTVLEATTTPTTTPTTTTTTTTTTTPTTTTETGDPMLILVLSGVGIAVVVIVIIVILRRR